MQSNTLISLFLFFCVCAVARVLAEAPKNAVDWAPCKQNASLPVTCGSLAVPLDYTNASSQEKLTLELVRREAKKQPKKGTILFNSGGPGIPDRNFLLGPYGEAILVAAGGAYDVIGFDPRYVSFLLSTDFTGPRGSFLPHQMLSLHMKYFILNNYLDPEVPVQPSHFPATPILRVEPSCKLRHRHS